MVWRLGDYLGDCYSRSTQVDSKVGVGEVDLCVCVMSLKIEGER